MNNKITTIKFTDPESGTKLVGEVISEKYIGEQKWLDVRVGGISWAVPAGYPNNASPICEESEPDAYSSIF